MANLHQLPQTFTFLPFNRHFSQVPYLQVCSTRINTRQRKLTAQAGKRYKGLEVLYDDGYQKSKDSDDYLRAVNDLATYDSGPPRWLCPLDGGPSIKDAPLLLFLPGMDGIGLGLFMHHEALGRIFELRCLHIPFHDRTPFEGLVTFIEDALKLELEHSNSPKRPIYLLGSSFGACLALAVASRNPDIDIVLVLVNPGTSFEWSELRNLFPLSHIFANQQCITMTYFHDINLGKEVKIAMRNMEDGAQPLHALSKLATDLSIPFRISRLLDKLPRDIFSWKVKLLKSAANYCNSHLHQVQAQTLVLASGRDNLFPSKNEAQRLQKLLLHCKVYYYEDHGHNLLMDYGVHLTTVIKCANMYRHSTKFQCVTDYLPPSNTELREFEKVEHNLKVLTSPVMFSTLHDGQIVRGLSGVPNDGPVLLVGNHMLLGLEMIPLLPFFLKEKQVMVRGVSNPRLLPDMDESYSEGHNFFDFIKLSGSVPLSVKYINQLLANGEFVLLYPGGYHEAYHQKDQQYKLMWPTQPQFVRLAAHFGATIVPFGTVGEDDTVELLLNIEDIMGLPFGKELIKSYSENVKLKDNDKNDVFFPGVVPKIPGRFYYLFGKPIYTRGKQDVLKDRKAASDLYFHVKSEVEHMISYLLKKREEDMYRNIAMRSLFMALRGSKCEIPSFEP